MKGRGEVERPAEPTGVTKHNEAPETLTGELGESDFKRKKIHQDEMEERNTFEI